MNEITNHYLRGIYQQLIVSNTIKVTELSRDRLSGKQFDNVLDIIIDSLKNDAESEGNFK